MGAFKRFVVFSNERTLAFEGDAPDERSFIEGLVAAGKSLAGCNLSGWELSGACLRSADLSGARLDGAVLLDADISGANLQGANLRGIRAARIMAVGADFTGAQFGRDQRTARRSDFTDGELMLSTFDHAETSNAVFTGCDMSGSSFVGTTGKRAVFCRVKLVGVDMALSRFVRCDFSGAVVADAPTATAGPHAGDRMLDATAVGNVYDNARIDPSFGAFLRDRKGTRTVDTVAWGVSTLALFAVGSQIPEIVDVSLLRDQIGDKTLFFGTLGLAVLLKERITDVVKNSLGDVMHKIRAAAGEIVAEAPKRLRSLRHLAAAVTTGPGARLLSDALSDTQRDARRRNVIAGFRKVACGSAEVFVCDRRHLGLALSRLAIAQTSAALPERDLLFVRDPDADAVAPHMLRLGADGNVTATWFQGSSLSRRFTWPFGSRNSAHLEIERSFSRALWLDHGLVPVQPGARGVVRPGAGGDPVAMVRDDARPRRNPASVSAAARAHVDETAPASPRI